MTLNVAIINKPTEGALFEMPVDNKISNYLLILMVLQSKTADYASNRQDEAAKDKKAASFMQSIINAMRLNGDFSPDTADKHIAFLKQVTEKLGKNGLGYNEEVALKQLNQVFVELNSIKEKMAKVQKEIASLQSEVKNLESEVSSHQNNINKYTSRYKKGGFIALGYNVFLAGKIIEYKIRKSDSEKELTLKLSEINSVKKPELEALRVSAQKIQKSFEGNKETEANKLALEGNNGFANAEAMLDAAMSASSLLKS